MAWESHVEVGGALMAAAHAGAYALAHESKIQGQRIQLISSWTLHLPHRVARTLMPLGVPMPDALFLRQ